MGDYFSEIGLTLFIDQHQTILRKWLDLLLPASAIDVNESKFARRFGLKDGQPHRAIRLLDFQLLHELGLPVAELSLCRWTQSPLSRCGRQRRSLSRTI